MKTLQEYFNEDLFNINEGLISEGRKQKLADAKSFLREIKNKYERNSSEYFKAMTDFFVTEILWKFPEISYYGTKTENHKMGYSGIPAKDYLIEYTYKNNVFGFLFNSFFVNPFCFFKINGKDITYDLTGSFDYDFIAFMCDKNLIAKYKDMISTIA